MVEKLFPGIMPALYTCFDDAGEVNIDEIRRLAEWLADKGAAGFYLCGTTGSGLLLNTDERMAIVEAISESVGDGIPLMVHVGAMSTRDSADLARHAAGCRGVKAISSLPPQFYPYSLEEEIGHLSEIASATDLPFYVYIFPATLEKYSAPALIDGFSRIPNMRGMKAFVRDLAVQQTFIRTSPEDWEILHGYDECLAYALMIPGIEGAIGSTYNIVPEIAVAIYRAAEEKDFERAAQLQYHFSGYWTAMAGMSTIEAGRKLLEMRGFDMGSPRPPLRSPSDAMMKRALAALVGAGFDIMSGGMSSF